MQHSMSQEITIEIDLYNQNNNRRSDYSDDQSKLMTITRTKVPYHTN